MITLILWIVFLFVAWLVIATVWSIACTVLEKYMRFVFWVFRIKTKD